MKEIKVKALSYETPIEILDISLDELSASIRLKNMFKYHDFKVVGDLVEITESMLIETPKFGRKTLNELRDKLRVLGYRLRRGWDPLEPSREKVMAVRESLYELALRVHECRDVLKENNHYQQEFDSWRGKLNQLSEFIEKQND